MAFLLLLVMLTACAAVPQDLSGKMMTFPEETSTANVKLIMAQRSFGAATVCLRAITDLTREHSLFSLASPRAHNAFLIFKTGTSGQFDLNVDNNGASFKGQDYELSKWHDICATWDSESSLVQLWIDGSPSIRKFIKSSTISDPIVILGQEQDSHGGKFASSQSFVGMISDVHMWNYVLSPCELQRYVEDSTFTPGNMLNWRALEFKSTGRVLIESKQQCN